MPQLTSQDVDTYVRGYKAFDSGTPFDPFENEWWQLGWTSRRDAKRDRDLGLAPVQH